MLPESLVEVLAEVLPQAGDAYVVGARSPALVALLSERGLDLVVIEPVESALDALVEAIGEVPAIVVDPESAPYEPETADVVACTLNPSRYAVAAMKAAVKPGGLAIVAIRDVQVSLLPAGPPLGWFRGWEIEHEGVGGGVLAVIARKPVVTVGTIAEDDGPTVVPDGPGGLPWPLLAPHRPVPSGGEGYVARPTAIGARLARMVRRSLTPVAVCAPVGFGKTTELLQVKAALAGEIAAIHLDVGPLGAADLAPVELLHEVLRTLVELWVEWDLDLMPSRLLIKDLRASDPRFPQGDGKARPTAELAAMVLGDLGAALGLGPVCLLVDGLDRLEPEVARAHAQGLLALRDVAHLLVAVDTRVSYGPEAAEVLAGYRVVSLPTLPVAAEHGVGWEEGAAFLREIALRRLGVGDVPQEVEALLAAAATWSGGVPRGFLSLVQGAAGYAEDLAGLGAGLDEAVRDAADALRRVMREADLDALAAADGTSGHALPIARRTRLLEHGLLLEYAAVDDVVVRVNPLVAKLVGRHRTQGL